MLESTQGGGGVIIPGAVQKAFRCCTEGCGLVGNGGGRRMVGLGDFGGLFQPMILCFSFRFQGRCKTIQQGREVPCEPFVAQTGKEQKSCIFIFSG